MKKFETTYPVAGTSALKANPYTTQQARMIAFPGNAADSEAQPSAYSLSRFANRPFEGYTKPQLYLAIALGTVLTFVALFA
ncbi:MAG: hypothetical protein Q4C41_05600 [Eggerthellaceae bacterium]|nr:hypothetical protein [Eggerthellaceae bacterium]